MMSLSEQIMGTILEEDSSLNGNLARCYQWIWHILLGFQPADVLRKMLPAIENAAHDAMPQHRLELAWKAQAIEELLAVNPYRSDPLGK